MTYGWNSSRGAYRQPYALDSLRKLKETGSEWIALSFYTLQANTHSTEIPFDYGHTMTDRDIEHAIKQAKALGLKVCLKPVVNSKDGIWRAHIGFPEEDGAKPYWDAWFESYGNFLWHYAEIAEELGCEMFCIGCEMVKTEPKTAHWEALIARIRTVYSGPLVYNANHGSEEGVAWFDLVDLIGTSAYYPVAKAPGESEDAMFANWLPVRDKLRRMHERFGKPIVFMEIGCRSALGCATMPWDFTHAELPASEAEQANFYGSVLRAFWDEPWFSGFFWWDWSVKLYPTEQAAADTGFDIHGKQAERVLREWYAKAR
ncbi:glycosyl hydrolase family 53 [Cohnella nanjingensis]|uniref:Glycosyl hydrolase family 53 n=1 Tax=Cohnella nanjingensis TaxID=1387779 RepID=A0A7X0RTT3_9BACL|nr:glycosyl hydrolase family 53 [Cohnella nanjingensis]MBB6673578.1 glycosyl hydrolase family 53 [Cohnella nanjingensis]